MKQAVMLRNLLVTSLTVTSALVSSVVFASERDPWESFNRKVYSFNDTLDVYFLKPVALGYHNVTPDFVERGVTNFFSNIYEVRTITNDLLQGKISQAGWDSTRFFINTTVGLFGVVDVATRIDLAPNDEDFGQTLSVWGVPSGPYLMLPVLGPSTVADATGRLPEMAMELFEEAPNAFFGVDDASIPMAIGYGISKRANLLEVEGIIAGDRYTFIRDAYLQRRDFLVNDGAISDDLLNNDIDEDFFEE